MKTIPTPSSASSDPFRILVTGAGGMLGEELVYVFRSARGELDEQGLLKEEIESSVLGTSHDELDITSTSEVAAMLDHFRPKWMVNAAAFTHVDDAESARMSAKTANVMGPKVLAQACAERKIRLLHFGTDQIFSGRGNRPITEDEMPEPLNYYAVTKLEGEREVLKAPGALVLRVQWLYGGERDRFRGLRSVSTFAPFNDQFGAPAWTREVALTCLELMDREASGVFHFAYDDWASWADIYAFVLECTGWPVRLTPRATAEAALPAARPSFVALSNAKLSKFLGRRMGSWKEPLRRYLKETTCPEE